MTRIISIPIQYPLKPNELPVEIVIEDGNIGSVYATINDVLIEFIRGFDGLFTTTTLTTESNIEKSYLTYIQRQLYRMFIN